MNNEQDSIWMAIMKSLLWTGALVSSITLAEIQAILGIIATTLVILGSAISLYTAIKRKAWQQTEKDEK
tara:strand:- start:1734 stop:1940 length:207 start_codon:yes stop_codon:yes gene_type:complete